jgi:hypothetical protein
MIGARVYIYADDRRLDGHWIETRINEMFRFRFSPNPRHPRLLARGGVLVYVR